MYVPVPADSRVSLWLTKETGAADETLLNAVQLKGIRHVFKHKGNNEYLHSVDNPALGSSRASSEQAKHKIMTQGLQVLLHYFRKAVPGIYQVPGMSIEIPVRNTWL